MWINQPSSLQPFHRMHDIRVFAELVRDDDYPTIYFLTGELESQVVHRLALSDGWPATSFVKPGHYLP
jgi:hypothetical protein